MCTVTVVRVGESARLACNRDELLSRPAASQPQVHSFGSRRAALPVDPVSGGTWVAVNDAGLAMTLLNVNPGDGVKDKTVAQRSRGTIILGLLHSDTLSLAVARATSLDPTSYAPFRLILSDRAELAELRSDGRQVRLVTRRRLTEPVLFTSSGLGDHLVEGPRQRLFAEIFCHSDDPIRQQEFFHRHHWPDRPHLSVCMRREDARTVSHTAVTLSPDRVMLSYRPDAPDRPAEVAALTLDLPPGGVR
jgi:hypothetical protein